MSLVHHKTLIISHKLGSLPKDLRSLPKDLHSLGFDFTTYKAFSHHKIDSWSTSSLHLPEPHSGLLYVAL